MGSIYDVTEFDEQAASKMEALSQLRSAVACGETEGVIGGYEITARKYGATSSEIDRALGEGRG